MPSKAKNIGTRIKGTEPAAWQTFVFLQKDDFKQLLEIERAKLQKSILANDFSQPFYAWRDDATGTIYCLDGKHRALILEQLIAEGYSVPELLPTTFMECRDIRDAAKMVLLYSSHYASVTPTGFAGFISTYSLDLPALNEEISIPNLSEDFPVLPIPDELEEAGKAKPAVMKITFESPEDLEAATSHIESFLKQQYPGAFFSVSCGEI